MKRAQLLEELAGAITRVELSHPTRVAIDGPDAAGKTTLAEELAPIVQSYRRPVIRASIDAVLPGKLQLANIVRVNLRDRRMALPLLIIAVGRPVAIAKRRLGERDCREEKSEDSNV